MSTLRISNIEAKSVPASATTDEKIKITNSSGDVLVFLDGKTSGITTVGINTTDGNLKFDANSNIVVSGIVTATAFYGDGSNLTGIAADKIFEGNTEVETVDTGSNGHIKFTTEGSERLRIDSSGRLLLGLTSDSRTTSMVISGNTSGATSFGMLNLDLGTTSVSADTNIGIIRFGATGDRRGADIRALGEGTWSAGSSHPTRLSFYTNAAGSAGTPTERLRIQSDGTLVTGAQTIPTSSDIGNIYIKNASAIGSQGHQINYVSNAVFNGAWKYINSGTGATQLVVNQNGYQFGVAGSGTAGNNITFNPALNISSAGAHKITCTASHYSANLSEMNTSNLALNIIKSRQGETKGIGIGAIGSANANTGIQAYDTSNNSANPLLINPFGGKICIGCPDNGTSNAGLNVEDSSNNSTNTLKLINKPSGANGKARLAFYTETSAGQGCESYIMSTSGTDAFGSNSANDAGLQFHTRHGGSGTDVNALELSNKGYVLKPQHPYFKANLSSGVRITGTGDVVFGSAVHNNGSHYNTSNGRFTAPIAGLYWFSCKINAYDRIDFRIRVNGSEVERGQYNTDSDNVGWWSNQLTTITYMTAGQYCNVNVSNLDQNADPDLWCTFMGYLIC